MVEVWVGGQGQFFRLRVGVVEIDSVPTVDVSVFVGQATETRNMVAFLKSDYFTLYSDHFQA